MKNPFTILNGIIITIILSIVGLVALIIFSGTLNFGLVEDDYYEKGLQYQKQITRTENTNKLVEPVEIIKSGRLVEFQFPEFFNYNGIEGWIHFYRPSDPSLDTIVPLNLTDEGIQQIDVNLYEHGAWIVKMNWEHNAVEYFIEKRIYLNN